jgi:hypothetical protein
MNKTEITEFDSIRCNKIISKSGYLIALDGGTGKSRSLKIYKRSINSKTIQINEVDPSEDFNFTKKIKISRNAYNFCIDSLPKSRTDLPKVVNILPNTKNNIDLNLIKMESDFDEKKNLWNLKVSGKVYNVIAYLSILSRSIELSKRIWSLKKDVEIYLPKFKIGDLVNIIGDKSNEMKVIGFELSGYVSPNRNDLVYKLIVLGNDYPNVIENTP